MTAAMRVALALDWIVALAWLGKTVQWLRGLSLVPDLRQMGAPTGAADVKPTPKDVGFESDAASHASTQPGEALQLSVIVPARDEARAIGACLRSLLASKGVAIEIIAVDDRSTDATGRIMDEVAAADDTGLLRAIHITTLPDGWMGKTHAMGRAAAEATGKWLLFTDGDMLFAPDALARVLDYAERETADHVILYPTMMYEGFGERMMLSFLHVMSIWGIRPWKVDDPAAKGDFIGIGAFNLVRRSVYDAVGGWSALRLEVLEDLRLGFTIKRAGYRQRAVFGRDLTRIRWAEGALGAVSNMTKNLFALFRFRLVLAMLALPALTGLCLLPFAGLALGWKGFAPLMLMLACLALLYRRYFRLGLPGVGYVLTFPIGSLLFLFAIARSIATTILRGGVLWRGTFYPLAALRKHAGPLR